MNFIKHRNRLLGLAGLAVVPVLVAGCGGVPGNAVATVDGTAITKKDYTHWAGAIAKSSGSQDATIPDPPSYAKCIAAKRAKLPKPGKGQPSTSDAQLKTQCKSENEQILNQTLTLLLQMEYVDKEAEQLDVAPSKAELQKNYDTQIKQSFPKKGDLEKFLKQSGLSESDYRMYLDNQLKQQKIIESVNKKAGDVTDADIEKYYNENKERFAQPERRDLRVVLTKTKGKAEEAKSAIEGGQSFAAVAKEFSIDQASKAQGGKLAGVAKGQQEQALDTAVFGAEKGELTGPVKTQFGWYVFEVTKETAASQQSLAEAKETIKQVLTSQTQQKALEKFSKDFEKEWKGKTECASGYKTTLCKNGPKATPTPTAPAGGATQPQQQQPQPTPTQ